MPSPLHHAVHALPLGAFLRRASGPCQDLNTFVLAELQALSGATSDMRLARLGKSASLTAENVAQPNSALFPSHAQMLRLALTVSAPHIPLLRTEAVVRVSMLASTYLSPRSARKRWLPYRYSVVRNVGPRRCACVRLTRSLLCRYQSLQSPAVTEERQCASSRDGEDPRCAAFRAACSWREAAQQQLHALLADVDEAGPEHVPRCRCGGGACPARRVTAAEVAGAPSAQRHRMRYVDCAARARRAAHGAG